MGCNCCCCRRRGSREIPEDVHKELVSTITIMAASCRQKHETDRLAALRLSDFEYKGKIGSGRFGKVYRVMERHTRKMLAMKEVRRKHDMYLLEPQLEQEYLILSKLKSYWLLDIIQCYETPSKMCMLLDYLPGPSLVRLARDRTASPRQTKVYAAEMLLALQAVHHHGYIHRDIKLSNFLLDAEGHVKLCDFGSCIRFLPADIAKKVFPLETDFRQAPTSEVLHLRQMLIRENQYKPLVPHGTSCYCAPEVIRLATRKPPSTPYSYLCDYWSLGVCYYYLLFGKLPFHTDEKVQLPSRIMNWQKTLKFPKARSAEDAAATCLVRGLLRDEVHRLGRNGVCDLLHYRFFSNVDWLPSSSRTMFPTSQTTLGDKDYRLARATPSDQSTTTAELLKAILTDLESLELSASNTDKKPRHRKKKKKKKKEKEEKTTDNETVTLSLSPPRHRKNVRSLSAYMKDILPHVTNTTPGASRILDGESPASTQPVDLGSGVPNDHNAPDANIGPRASSHSVSQMPARSARLSTVSQAPAGLARLSVVSQAPTGSRESSHNVSQTPAGPARLSTISQAPTGSRESSHNVCQTPAGPARVSTISQAPTGSRESSHNVSQTPARPPRLSTISQAPTDSRESSHNVCQTPASPARLSVLSQAPTGRRANIYYSNSRLPVVSKVSRYYSVALPVGSRLSSYSVSRVCRGPSQARLSPIASEEKPSGKVDTQGVPDAQVTRKSSLVSL